MRFPAHTGTQGLTFLLPALVLFAIFVLYPAFYIFYAGLFEWDGINQGVFVGLGNFHQIFTDDGPFWIAMRNALYWAPLTIVIQMVLGFLIAFLLEIRTRMVPVFRALFYLPAIVSPVVIGIVWQRIYNPFGGLLSDIGIATGLRFLTFSFLANTQTAIFAVIVVNIWQWMGFSMLMYIAGMKGISREVLEAARLDGITTRQTAVHVVWPMLRHVHLTLVLLGVIGTLQTFPLIYIMTKGGPNHATEMLPNYIFQQGFILQNMGYASALSVVLLVLSLGLSVFQVKVLGARFSFGGPA
ncbi:MAG: sugar ABC transporter permease [Bauldia sp.]|uniref:carbohydrate ABC transporter permease n=1 Tax=Bauldia sp. TaxID=2575872 RepID=UPI001DACD38E|nr:sugar ABC transporter permease [Bauldia sp.]MCB1495846.1 sugar ABC transporter permease [Bauldia sp.]